MSGDSRAVLPFPSHLLHSAQATAFDTRRGWAGGGAHSGLLVDMVRTPSIKPKDKEGEMVHRSGCHANSKAAADVSDIGQMVLCPGRFRCELQFLIGPIRFTLSQMQNNTFFSISSFHPRLNRSNPTHRNLYSSDKSHDRLWVILPLVG